MAEYGYRQGALGSPGMLSPEQQQRLIEAQQLRQSNDVPGGKMVSGHYVGPSWTQYLAQGLKNYMGGRQQREVMDEVSKQRQAFNRAITDPLTRPEDIPIGIRDPSYQGESYIGRLSQLGQEGNYPASEMARQLRMQQIQQESQPKPSLVRGSEIGANPEAVYQYMPGEGYSEVYAPQQPDLPAGMFINEQGQAQYYPGYLEGQQAIRSAGRSSVKVNTGNQGPQFGTIPKGYMMVGNEQDGYRMTAVPGGPAEQEEMKAEEQKQMAQEQRERYGDVVTDAIDTVMRQVDEATIPVTSFGSMLSNVPGTTARDVKANLDTIRANVGFDRLQQMRDASPTGGALGQVSEMENRLLQSTLGNLEMSQSEAQFMRNLKQVRDIYDKIVNEGISEDEAEQLLREQAVQRMATDDEIDPELLNYMTPEERELFQ